MKIKLEYPFSDKWRLGYLVVNKENRKHVILYNSKYDRSTMSYARYLMSVHLKRFIPDELQVDHIDDDKTNDSISNLQLLTQSENLLKQNPKKVFTKICQFCNLEFSLSKNHKTQKTCSKSYGSKLMHLNRLIAG